MFENNSKYFFVNIFCKDFKMVKEEISVACSVKEVYRLEESYR